MGRFEKTTALEGGVAVRMSTVRTLGMCMAVSAACSFIGPAAGMARAQLVIPQDAELVRPRAADPPKQPGQSLTKTDVPGFQSDQGAQKIKNVYLDTSGQARAITEDDRDIILSGDEICRDIKLADDGLTIGWKSQPGGDFSPMMLVIWRGGRIVRTLETEAFYIIGWSFWERGTQVSVAEGGIQWGGVCNLYDLETGKVVATSKGPFISTSPDWARMHQSSENSAYASADLRLSGPWRGKLTQAGTGKEFTLNMDLVQKNGRVTGSSLIAAGENMGVMDLEGSVEGMEFHFAETMVTGYVGQPEPGEKWLLKKGCLWYSDGETEGLNGMWKAEGNRGTIELRPDRR